MKPVRYTFLLTALLFFSKDVTAQNNGYDSVLAKKLQADDYGMKSYVLVILKEGSSTDTSKTARTIAFRGHMANIHKLANENKLVIAGPMGENDKHYEGIFVFNTADMNEAKQWVNSDPAIQAKYLDAELYPWYCSAALQQIPALHEKVTKTKF